MLLEASSKTRKSRKPQNSRKKQSNKVPALSTTTKIKEINIQDPFDIAWEEKTKSNVWVFLLRPIPKNENSEITEILQKGLILKCENVVEMLFK